MSFSTVGLYGLPLGTMPGTAEALIHQQSNAAYAEFRKQMLSQSNVSRSRRGSHRGILPGGTDSKATSNQHTFSFENESNDCPSTPDDLTGGVGKSEVKSEQQVKFPLADFCHFGVCFFSYVTGAFKLIHGNNFLSDER